MNKVSVPHDKRPTKDVAARWDILRAEPAPMYPADLPAAIAFILAEQLPELSDYDGCPGAQESMAHEIADQIFVAGADFSQALAEWSQGKLSEQVQLVDITDTAAYTSM